MAQSSLHVQRFSLNNNLERDLKKYPFTIPVIKNFEKFEFHKPVTFIIGENGTGKSSLLEAFAVCAGFNPEGGTKNFNFATMASHSDFHKYLKISRTPNREKDGFFFRAESYYNMASEMEKLDAIVCNAPPIKASYGGKSLHEQSHGESFLAMLQHRLGGNGLYIFDEPEAALSPMRMLTLLARIDDLVKNNSQFIISTHSPILMAYPNAEIYEINDGKLQKTVWNKCMHVLITQYFLQNPQKMLKELGIENF
jgi:predicted ATPase